MLVLISPAKTLDFESTIKSELAPTKPYFLSKTKKLVQSLSNLSTEEIGKLMGISKKLAQLNYNRFQEFNEAKTRSAIFAYKGDVYEGFELDKYSSQDFEYANKTIRIISGLYGILKPSDEIAPYRLEMSTGLKNTEGKDLYKFWIDSLTTYLNEEKEDYIINLASNEYFSALGKLTANVINVIFRDKGKIVGILAKKARGTMANYIVQKRISKPQELKNFSLLGYSYIPSESSESTYVFTR